MSEMKYISILLFLFHSVIAAPQLNLYFTDWIIGSENGNDNSLQHNCLHIPIIIERYQFYLESIINKK